MAVNAWRGAAFLLGAVGNLRWSGMRSFLASGLMMVLFFHAARLAWWVFDPYLSSRPLADAFASAPPGKLIVDHHLLFLFVRYFLYRPGPLAFEREV